jgi:acyl-CoA dehydrogenase
MLVVCTDPDVRKRGLSILMVETETASMAKYWATDVQQQVLDQCVQVHGGHGYMNEYLVCRMFADARVHRIHGGTTEILKEFISRSV